MCVCGGFGCFCVDGKVMASAYQQDKDNDYFVKNKDGNEYEGWCWPGKSEEGRVRGRSY